MTQGLGITYERQFEREAKTSKEKVANPSSSTCNFQAYNNDAITITNTTNTTTRYKCRVKPKYCATDSRRTKPRTGKKDMKSRLQLAFPLQSEKKDEKEREIQRSMQPRQSVLHFSKKKRENQKKKSIQIVNFVPLIPLVLVLLILLHCVLSSSIQIHHPSLVLAYF